MYKLGLNYYMTQIIVLSSKHDWTLKTNLQTLLKQFTLTRVPKRLRYNINAL